MAQVPTLTAPNVLPGGPALPAQNIGGITPDAFGASIGQATEKFGDVMNKHALHMRQRINEADSTETYLRATEEASNLSNKFMTLEGKNRQEALPQYLKDLDGVHKKYRSTLGTPDAQHMFDRDFKRRMGYDMENAGKAAATGLRQYEKGAREGRIALAVREAADADDAGFALAVHDAGIAVAQENEAAGRSKAEGEAIKIKTLSALYESRLRSLSITDPERAQRIYEANKANMDTAVRERIEGYIQKGLLGFKGRQGSDEIWENTKPAVGPERLGYQRGNLKGVRPELFDVLKTATRDLPEGYRAEIISGKDARGTGTTNHPGGIALDVIIYDDKGNAIPHNRSDHAGVKVYEQLYQSVRERGRDMYPNTQYIWGGAWVSSAAGYGDPMHYQIYDPKVFGSSPSSGKYDPDKGISPESPFAPFMMTPDELGKYREGLKGKTVRVAQNDGTVTDAAAAESTPDLSTNRLQRALAQVPEYAAKTFPENEGARLQLEETLRTRIINRYNTDKKVMAEHRQGLRMTVLSELIPNVKGEPSQVTVPEQLSSAAQAAYHDMDPGQQRLMQRQMLANARADVPLNNDRFNRYQEAMGKSVTNPDEFMQIAPGELDIPRTLQGKIFETQRKIQSKMQDTTKINSALRTVAPMLNDAGIYASKDDRSKNAQFNSFVGAFDTKLKEYEEQFKKFPTEEEQRQIASRLLTDTTNNWFFSNQKNYEVPDWFTNEATKSFKTDPRFGGRNPTAGELFRLYEKAGRPKDLDSMR